MVENLVAIELAYINTKHPDFHKDAALVPSLLKADNIMEPYGNQQQRRSNTPRAVSSSPQVMSQHHVQQLQQQQQHQQQQQQPQNELDQVNMKLKLICNYIYFLYFSFFFFFRTMSAKL